MSDAGYEDQEDSAERVDVPPRSDDGTLDLPINAEIDEDDDDPYDIHEKLRVHKICAVTNLLGRFVPRIGETVETAGRRELTLADLDDDLVTSRSNCLIVAFDFLRHMLAVEIGRAQIDLADLKERKAARGLIDPRPLAGFHPEKS